MIPIVRTDLEDTLAAKLIERTAKLKAINADSIEARKAWRRARIERLEVRMYLGLMAAGVERCMYCGDNLGTDIDHFEPISRAPLKTFEWPNHLLACSFCNSNKKRDLFPCDPMGCSLLVNPASEDPRLHLSLILSTGEYMALTPRGMATIEVFGLNRRDLTRGREAAFETRRAVLCRSQALLNQSREAEARRLLQALAEQPHASVLLAMLASMNMPGVEEVLGADVVAALQDPRIRLLIGMS